MTDETLMRTMLFDFYGELLTGKQREYYDLHYNEDLSLYEIAEQNGVSRQAVWDISRRAEAAMTELEEKTGFVKRAARRRETAEKIAAEAGKLPDSPEKRRIIELLDALED